MRNDESCKCKRMPRHTTVCAPVHQPSKQRSKDSSRLRKQIAWSHAALNTKVFATLHALVSSACKSAASLRGNETANATSDTS